MIRRTVIRPRPYNILYPRPSRGDTFARQKARHCRVKTPRSRVRCLLLTLVKRPGRPRRRVLIVQ